MLETPACRNVRDAGSAVSARGVGMRLLTVTWSVVLFASVFTSCSSGSGSHPSPSALPPAGPTPTAVRTIDLPAPRTDGTLSLEEALAHRESVREFGDGTLTTEQLAQLLWAAQGITRDWGGRTAPSAGALYPLELYVALPEGLWHYLPRGHRVEVLSERDVRTRLATAALGQSPAADAPAVFVVTAVPARTEVKYGDRTVRYVTLEAGHAAQNLLLEAVVLGLGAVPIGAFDDDAVLRALGLPGDRLALYLIPVGRPGA